MKIYTCSAVEQLINEYLKYDGAEIITVEEGSLGYGFMIMTAPKCKTTIVHEVYVNEWTSAHKIRMYNKMPNKYARIIEEYYEREDN